MKELTMILNFFLATKCFIVSYQTSFLKIPLIFLVVPEIRT